jgi:hypothetical protein
MVYYPAIRFVRSVPGATAMLATSLEDRPVLPAAGDARAAAHLRRARRDRGLMVATPGVFGAPPAGHGRG